MELKDLLEEFRQYKVGRQNRKPQSIAVYIDDIIKFFQYIKKNPEEVKIEDIEKYLIHLKVDKKLAINTQKLRQAAIRMFYDWYSKRYHKENPCELLYPIQEEIKIPMMPTPDELIRMIYKCNLSNIVGRRNAAIICLLADTGIRLAECEALNVSNIQIHQNNYVLLVPRIKTNRERIVPFGELTQGNLIGEFFSAYYSEIKYSENYRNDGPLFKQHAYITSGNRLSKQTITRIIGTTARKAGIDKQITPHSLRHFFATYSVIHGTEIRHLRELMGHAWLETTMRYVHISEVIKASSIRQRGTHGLKADPQQTGFVKIIKEAFKHVR